MKRYDMFAVNDGHELQECADGEWVRFEDHEQELRETAGELEKARADVLTFTSRALLAETGLTEATALLVDAKILALCEVSYEDYAVPWLERYMAFLSRAPAQPAAPTPEQIECSSCKYWLDAPTHNYRWPAAPEPSVCARFSGCEGSGYATILGTGGDAAPCEECKLGKVYKRAEAAEARLAAVRARLAKAVLVLESGLHSRNYRTFAVRVLAALTPAPSHGAEECDAHHAFECKLCPGAGGGK